MLGPLDGVRVLDLYAGSGALAIEALSRGAARAVLVERDRAALAALRGNLQALGLDERARVLGADVLAAAARIGRLGPYDLILADPPYDEVASGGAPRALEQLAAVGPLLADEGRLVLEHAARNPSPAIRPWSCDRSRRYGDTALSFYVRAR